MRTRLVLPAAFGLVVVLSLSGPALAHARLLEESPTADSVVAAATTELRLHFSEAFELALTSITLTGSGAMMMATGSPTIAAGDETILLVPLAAPLPGGTYTVDWHVVAKDGHGTRGSYHFSVR